MSQVFLTPAGGQGLAAGAVWSLDEVDRSCAAMRRGSAHWSTGLGHQNPGWSRHLSSDYCPYEGAVAHTL